MEGLAQELQAAWSQQAASSASWQKPAHPELQKPWDLPSPQKETQHTQKAPPRESTHVEVCSHATSCHVKVIAAT